MKQIGKLIWTLILPSTIILFGTVTKWRYVIVEDGPNEFLYGFPWAFRCRGWHTSLSLQIFVAEMVGDFFVYFICCLVIVLLANRFVKRLIIPKYLKFGLYGLSTIIILVYGIVFANPENVFVMKRDFNYKEVKQGYKFVWQRDAQ